MLWTLGIVAGFVMGHAAGSNRGPGDTGPPWMDTSLRVDDRVELLVAQMTLQEKMAQLLSSHVPKNTTDLLNKYGASGFGVACLPYYKVEPNATAADLLTWRDSLQRSMMAGNRLRIPVSFRAELLHSGALPGTTVFPMPALIGTAWNRSLAGAIAAASAAIAIAGGVDYGFGPVLQVATDARWGRLQEAYGEDPTLVSELGIAAIEGFQGAGGGTGEYIAAPSTQLPMQTKHFASYGAMSHDTLPVDLGIATLHDVYLRPFRALSRRGSLRAVMATHPPVRGSPACANRWLLTRVLRTEWPDSVNTTVASDCGDIRRLSVDEAEFAAGKTGWNLAAGPRAAAELALAAGLDQELDIGTKGFIFPLVVGNGSSTHRSSPAAGTAAPTAATQMASPPGLERAVRNTLRLKFASGLFDREGRSLASPTGTVNATVRKAHEALAVSAVHQGAVLLINRDNDVLPLAERGLPGTVAVIGPNGDGEDARAAMLGGYSGEVSHGGTKDVVATVADAVRAEPGTRAVSVGAGGDPCNTTVDGAAVASAVAMAKASELALVVIGDSGGLVCQTCGEGRDRTSLELPGSQLALLTAVLDGVDPAKTRVAVILIHGRPITFGADPACGRLQPCHNALLRHPALGAVIAAFRPGQFGAKGLLDLVVGREPFVGKLTQAWPRSAGEVGAAGVGPWFGLPLRQGIPLDSDAYADGLKTPLFPFAHGLTPGGAFAFSALTVNDESYGNAGRVGKNGSVVASVTVHNAGPRRSAATVQLYYSPPVAPFGVLRHARRLIGFQRTWLGAGETASVELAFEVADALSRWDEFGAEWAPGTSPGWVVDVGRYGLHVGDCCVSGVVNSSATCPEGAQVSTSLEVT